MIRPGKDCDVFPTPKGFGFAYAQPQGVVFELLDLGVSIEVRTPEPLLYLRGVGTRNLMAAIGQGNHSGDAFLVWSDGRVENLGPTHGQNCVALWTDDVRVRAYIQRSATTFSIVTEGSGTEDLPIPIGLTSQGFRDVLLDGTIVWGDQAKVRELHKRTFHAPMQRGPLVVGQADPPRILAAFEPKEHVFTAFEGLAWEPHVAQIGERFAICARTPAGSRVEIFAPPYPAHEAPTPTPTPIPTPTPTPTPMPIPSQLAIVQRVRAKYPTPLGPSHAAFLLELAKEIGVVEGLKAGLLRKDGGTNILLPDGTRVAQDIICFSDGRIFDCLGDGEGAASPSWGEAEGSPIATSRYYEVTGTIPVPVPVPVPQPCSCSAEIAELRIQIGEARAKAAAAQAEAQNAKELAQQALTKPLPALRVKGSTGRAWSHTHNVDLEVVPE